MLTVINTQHYENVKTADRYCWHIPWLFPGHQTLQNLATGRQYHCLPVANPLSYSITMIVRQLTISSQMEKQIPEW